MPYVPKVDESACLAHGDCAEVAPHVFSVDEIADVVGDAPFEQLLEAAEACPAGAISVIDTETGAAVYP